jgi:glycosyltransferase involved in cell wall biosynthesis|tara:strand:- start:4324 stop:5418 length:1095 start_codon:yes stop_codon:yes gene_type:complete
MVMKVLYDNSIFFKQSYGGISKYFFKLFNNFDNQKDINFFVSSFIHKNEYLNEYSSESIYLKKYPLFSKTFFEQMNKFKFKKDHYVYKPDIIHYTYYGPQISTQSKSIVTVYDLIHEKFYKKYGLKKPFFEHRKKILDSMDIIISISENTKKDLIKIYKINENKIHTVYLGLDIKKNITNDEINYTNNNPYILYVGNRSKHKNFISVIKAFSSSKKINSNFKFICFGGGEFNISEKKLFNDLNLNKKIEYIHGNDLLLQNLYKKSNLFVYSTLYEGFGLPPMEAIQNNCPALISNVGSLKEIYDDGVMYVNNPLDINEWSENMKTILFEDRIKNDYLTKGKKRIQLYSWQKCADQTKNLYKKLL